MNLIRNQYHYNAKEPVLIYENDGKKMRGVIIGVNSGDVVETRRMHYFLINEITRRYTPPGHFIVNVADAGFEALVEPCDLSVQDGKLVVKKYLKP
jgi:hypothetical protein